MKDSELTFHALTKDLGFIKVTWNKKVIYDDTTEVEPISLKDLYKEYGNRFVYSMKIKVVDGHHCELDITGEPESTSRQLVFGLYFKPDIYEHDYLEPEEFKILNEVKQKSTIRYLENYINKFEYTLGRKGKFYKVKVYNPHGWLGYCFKNNFYIYKEESE